MKYPNAEIDKLLSEIEKIADENERSVVVSQVWWHHFTKDSHPRCSKLSEMRAELPYPKDEVTQLRVRELVENIPDRFKKNLTGFTPSEFEGHLKSKHREEQGSSEDAWSDIDYSVSPEIQTFDTNFHV